MKKSCSTYIGFGEGVVASEAPLTRSRSYIVKKMKPSSKALSSSHSRAKAERHSSNISNIQSLETNFSKTLSKYTKIFTRNIKRLSERKKRDDRKLEDFQNANVQMRIELKREIELLEGKYGPRRTTLIYHAMTKEREIFFKKVERSLKARHMENSDRFREMVYLRFQSSFDLGIDLLQMPTKEAFVPPTHLSRAHDYFSHCSNLQREVSFNDFITSAIKTEKFIHFLIQSYSKDLANISDRAKSDTFMDQMEITLLKSLLKTLLGNQIPSTRNTSVSSESERDLQFQQYFTRRIDFNLSNLKIAYLYYNVYKRTDQMDRALRLIVKAVDANISSLSVYLEFFVKYFQIFEYINEVFPNRFKKKADDGSTKLQSFKKAVRSIMLLGVSKSATSAGGGLESSPLPITFSVFFERLTDFRTRFEYIYQTYKYLSSLFSLAEVKEMLLEVADNLLRSRRYATAQRYYLFIIYMFENIDVFELYKTRSGLVDRQSSKQEAIQRTYSVLRLNQKIFQVNNKFIEVCIETRSHLQALIFIINNHYLYKNSMKQIEEHDPCRYATKNPNEIILQNADEYEMNIEEKTIFQRLFNSFKVFYKQTLELHRKIWEVIKEDEDKAGAGSLTRYRNLLERLESMTSYDKKSYLELLNSIKVRFSISSLDQASNSLYVPHFLGYTKKRDHINYITEKIHKVIGEEFGEERKRDKKGFSRETASSNKKREDQINVEDIERFLDVKQEDSRVLDLILRVGLLYLYQDLKKSSIFTMKSYAKWMLSDWQPEALAELNGHVTVLQTRIRKFLQRQREKKKQLSEINENTCSPVELSKKVLKETGEPFVLFVNEFGKQYFVRRDKSQFHRMEVGLNTDTVKQLGVFREIAPLARMVKVEVAANELVVSLPSFSFTKDKPSYEARRQSILAANVSFTYKKEIDHYFQKLKTHFEHSYIDQEHSITTINNTVFRFSEVFNQRQLSFGISAIITESQPIRIRLVLPNSKKIFDSSFIDLTFNIKNLSTSGILQNTLKAYSFKFYTFLPALHSYLTKEYFSKFFGSASPQRFRDCSLAVRVGEALKQMGLVFSLVLIDFPSFQVNDLQSIDIGLFNHFDYSFLQSFLAIGRFLLNFLTKTKSVSVYGQTNKKIAFEKIFNSGALVNRSGDAIVLGIYCQKLFIFAQNNMNRNSKSIWDKHQMVPRTETDLGLRRIFMSELEINFRHPFHLLIDLLPLMENLKYTLSVFRNSVGKSAKKNTLKYPFCFLVARPLFKVNDNVVSFNFVIDLGTLEENHTYLQSDLGKLINRARSLDPPLSPSHVFDTILLKLANSFIKTEVRVLVVKNDPKPKPVLLKALAAENILSLKTGEAPLHFPIYSSLSVTQVVVLCLLQDGVISPKKFLSLLEFERDHIRVLLLELLINPTDPLFIRKALTKAWHQWRLEALIIRSSKSDEELIFDYKSLEIKLKQYVDLLVEWTQSSLVLELIDGPAKVRLLFGKQIFYKVFNKPYSSNKGEWTKRLEGIENDLNNIRMNSNHIYKKDSEMGRTRGLLGKPAKGALDEDPARDKRLENLQRKMEAQLNTNKRGLGNYPKIKDFEVSGDVIEANSSNDSVKLLFTNGHMRLSYFHRPYTLIIRLELGVTGKRLPDKRHSLLFFSQICLSDFSLVITLHGRAVDLSSKVNLSTLFKLLDPRSLQANHISDIIDHLLYLHLNSVTPRDQVRCLRTHGDDFHELLDHNQRIRNIENHICIIKEGRAQAEMVLELEKLHAEYHRLRSLDESYLRRVNMSLRDKWQEQNKNEANDSELQGLLSPDTVYKEVEVELPVSESLSEGDEFPRNIRNLILNKTKSINLDQRSLAFLRIRKLSDLGPLLKQTDSIYFSYDRLATVANYGLCKVEVEFVLINPNEWVSIAFDQDCWSEGLSADPVTILSKVVMRRTVFPANGILFKLEVVGLHNGTSHSLLLSSKELDRLFVEVDPQASWSPKQYFKSAINLIIQKLVFAKSKIGVTLFINNVMHMSSSGCRQSTDKANSNLTFVEIKSLAYRIVHKKIIKTSSGFILIVVGVFKRTLFFESYNPKTKIFHLDTRRITKSAVTPLIKAIPMLGVSARAFMRALRRVSVFQQVSFHELSVFKSLSESYLSTDSCPKNAMFIGSKVLRHKSMFYFINYWLRSELLLGRTISDSFSSILKIDIDHYELTYSVRCHADLPFEVTLSLRNAYKSYLTQKMVQNKMVTETIAFSQLIEISEIGALDTVQQHESTKKSNKNRLGQKMPKFNKRISIPY